jgi:hypothetical protein
MRARTRLRRSPCSLNTAGRLDRRQQQLGRREVLEQVGLARVRAEAAADEHLEAGVALGVADAEHPDVVDADLREVGVRAVEAPS